MTTSGDPSTATVASVLAVDDEPSVCRSHLRVLDRAGYASAGAHDLATARAALVERRFDLLLCDVDLGGESGLDLVREVSRELPDVAVVMVTGIDDPEIAEAALTLGAYGYLVKPFAANELLIQIDFALRRRALERARRSHVEELEGKLLDRSTALRDAFRLVQDTESEAGAVNREMADRLTLALTLRNEETGWHIERVGRYTVLLAERAGIDHWPPADLQIGAMLHDIGKIAVPDMVLLKPGELSPEERALVRRHPETGNRLLETATGDALRLGASIALTHHERWDGLGYPHGLAREGIPVEGRLTAIADTFDAMTSDRVYRPAMALEDVVAVLERERGHQFDPDLVDVFLGALDDMLAIRSELSDPEPSEQPITVLLVDDHVMFTETLVRLLDRTEGIAVVGTATTVEEAVRRSDDAPTDVVVAKWRLPDGTAAQLARHVRAGASPAAQVIALTDEHDDAILLAALDAGCAGCIGKHRAFDELTTAIRAVHAGQALVPPAQLASLLRRLLPLGTPTARAELTPRDLEVLRLMSQGLSTEAITERLGLSLYTVRNHIQRVITKLEAHSRLEAVTTGIRAGLVSPVGH